MIQKKIPILIMDDNKIRRSRRFTRQLSGSAVPMAGARPGRRTLQNSAVRSKSGNSWAFHFWANSSGNVGSENGSFDSFCHRILSYFFPSSLWGSFHSFRLSQRQDGWPGQCWKACPDDELCHDSNDILASYRRTMPLGAPQGSLTGAHEWALSRLRSRQSIPVERLCAKEDENSVYQR